ncbi:NAD(P)/FAD-dependent oxidoreductase [Maribacter sp. 2307ULW6-5]|uniref:NAD(P)/FAD-dependent oxidoreductase n=1 Tax=Maribacter sp. 2307ULW6-5 TaxID=3386275 RepID=UPI0039BD48E2
MALSYWEHKTWLSRIGFTVVGSGIVGLNCALALKQAHPKAKVVVLERGVLPNGASTKNAGFACFGSVSELLNDLEHHTEAQVVQLVKTRAEGILALRELLGDTALDYHQWGGHDLFLKADTERFEHCLGQLQYLNTLLAPIFGKKTFVQTKNIFGLEGVQDHLITQVHEGQLNTGKMMHALLHKVQQLGIVVLNGVTVTGFEANPGHVTVATDHFEYRTQQLYLATNGFAKQLIKTDVQPARAQALITKPLPLPPPRGTFHLDQGYYYFRNVDGRVLLGGGRNLDFATETTFEQGETALVRKELERLLKEVILPGVPFEVDRYWSGIMGVGHQKKPMVEALHPNVACGVGLGGMGVAMGTAVGRSLAAALD